MQARRGEIGTAIAGPSAAFRKSEVASPTAVVNTLVTQKKIVICGTLVTARWAFVWRCGMRLDDEYQRSIWDH
jgi:hypothetical protein